jgi:3-oxoacyl-[acyl-carrier protein] reductase
LAQGVRIKMKMGLEGKSVLIAGGSRGIGLAIAETFLKEKAKVIITGRDRGALDRAAQEALSAFGKGNILAIHGDMTKEEAIQEAVAKVKEVFSRIDIVIANIGSGVARPGWDLEEEDWSTVLNANFFSGMRLGRAVIPELIQTRGNLVFVSSIVGLEAVNAPITYSAAKAALNNAVKNLSRLLGSQGVRVNAVAPGNVLFPGGSWEAKMKDRQEFFEDYIRCEVPLQRFGTPHEIADVVVFLSSERASFITGACIVADGGQTRSM